MADLLLLPGSDPPSAFDSPRFHSPEPASRLRRGAGSGFGRYGQRHRRGRCCLTLHLLTQPDQAADDCPELFLAWAGGLSVNQFQLARNVEDRRTFGRRALGNAVRSELHPVVRTLPRRLRCSARSIRRCGPVGRRVLRVAGAARPEVQTRPRLPCLPRNGRRITLTGEGSIGDADYPGLGIKVARRNTVGSRCASARLWRANCLQIGVKLGVCRHTDHPPAYSRQRSRDARRQPVPVTGRRAPGATSDGFGERRRVDESDAQRDSLELGRRVR